MHQLRKNKVLVCLSLSLLLVACSLSLSIFQWKVVHNTVNWTRILDDGEIYTVTSTEEFVNGRDLISANLYFYRDDKEQWRTAINIKELTTIVDVQVDNYSGTVSKIYVFTKSWGNSEVQLTSYNQGGEELDQTIVYGFVSSQLNAQTLGVLVKRNESIHLDILNQNQWQKIATLESEIRTPTLHSQNGRWVIVDTVYDQIEVLSNEGTQDWYFEAGVDSNLGEVLIGKDTLVVSKLNYNDTGLFFFDGETGQSNLVSQANLTRLFTLDEQDLPYVGIGSKTEILIQKIDFQGSVLWESSTDYSGGSLGSVLLAPSGNVVVSYQTGLVDGTDDNGIIMKYTSQLDVLDELGELVSRYVAEPFRLSYSEGCVEYCSLRVVKTGYSISTLFISQDDEYYVRGSIPTIPIFDFGFSPNYDGFFAKVNLSKTTD